MRRAVHVPSIVGDSANVGAAAIPAATARVGIDHAVLIHRIEDNPGLTRVCAFVRVVPGGVEPEPATIGDRTRNRRA